jgi:hypothetical protein
MALVIALSTLPQWAQTPYPQPSGPDRPASNPYPAEQNWVFLANPSKRTDFFDPVKYISLGETRNCTFRWDSNTASNTSTTTTGCLALGLKITTDTSWTG